MTRLSRVLTVLPLLALLASCDAIKNKLKGAGADAGDDAATAIAEVPDSAPPPAIQPIGANENDVARFPDEVPLDTPATVQRVANVRVVPAVGALVAALPKGTTVTQRAQREKYFLVSFDDPKTPGQKLAGWVTQDAFSAVVSTSDAGVKPLTCTAPDIPLFSDVAFCGRACAKDSECPAGQVCKGSAARLKNGKPSDSTTVCSAIVTHDAGAPVVVASDAGAGGLGLRPSFLTLGGDAGAKVIDAGAAPAADLDVVDAKNGQCEVGFLYVKQDKKCHRLCPSFNCKNAATQRCIKCGTGVKICSAVNDLCK
jgi:hypothetical protein